MSKYIDAEEAMHAIDRERTNRIDFNNGLIAAIIAVNREPAADVEEVRYGEWVRDADLIDGDVWARWSCSECGYVRTRGWEDTNAGAKPRAKWCENCGAKMDEKEQRNGQD